MGPGCLRLSLVQAIKQYHKAVQPSTKNNKFMSNLTEIDYIFDSTPTHD
jgi:hypothetical protein